MASRILFPLLCVVLVVSCIANAADSESSSQESAAGAEQKFVHPSFPYIARVTDGNVNIRSGPGTNYYACGQLNAGDLVKVIASKYSWSHIVPPSGSFSWISKRYVTVDAGNPELGVVTGDQVRVYAGSDHLKPIHSTTLQLKFNTGDQVQLLGEEVDEYYKIAPPKGAYLWVSTQYTDPTGPVSDIGGLKPDAVVVNKKVSAVKQQAVPQKAAVTVPTKASPVPSSLKGYYSLKSQIEAERKKPFAQQNYGSYKSNLQKIADNKLDAKAAKYASFTLEQIDGYELVIQIDKAIKAQEIDLKKVQAQIEDARVIRLKSVPDLGRFAVVGRIQESNIYSAESITKHYRIVADSGKILCYAIAMKQAASKDLAGFIGKKVGLVGTIEPYKATAGAIVRFTEIVELDQSK